MKILIVDTFYGPYLERLYAGGGLAKGPWCEQHRAHFAGSFGTGDAYSYGLGRLGVPAIEIVANSAVLQRAWALEHRPELLELADEGAQLLRILEAQIQWWQPTVLYVQDINWLPTPFLQHVKPLVQLVVGQNACPLAPNLDLSPYDLLLTSLPHYVGRFRAMGVEAAYFPIGFDERLLQRHNTHGPRAHPLTFVGALGGYHRQGTRLLEAIAKELPLQVWGYGGQQLPDNSTLKKRWQGEAWGDTMYGLLANSQITINRHIDIAESYACNMRLYEATGMGSCLVTEHKSNIATLFEPDKEIVTFESREEAISKIRDLMNNQAQAKQIAKAGKMRSLNEHSYTKRMGLLLQILKVYHKKMSTSTPPETAKTTSKCLSIPVFSMSDSIAMARQWANKIREALPTPHEVEFNFLTNEKVDPAGESIWMLIKGESVHRLAESYFNSIKTSGFAIIIETSSGIDDPLRSAFINEAIQKKLLLKHIRL